MGIVRGPRRYGSSGLVATLHIRVNKIRVRQFVVHFYSTMVHIKQVSGKEVYSGKSGIMIYAYYTRIEYEPDAECK
jgi:hypothetical protein